MAVGRVSLQNGPPLSQVNPALPETTGRARRFLEVLGEGARAPPATGPPRLAPASPAASAGVPLRALARGALDAERKIDAVLAAAASGRTFSATQLLAMQIEVFRYSQAVEVISRGVDRVVGAVRQAMSTQV
jgi:hypothetical protein